MYITNLLGYLKKNSSDECPLNLYNFFNIIIQGQPILICEDGTAEDLKRFSDQILKIPPIIDCLNGVLTVIPLQLMSFHIATLKGLNVSNNLFKY